MKHFVWNTILCPRLVNSLSTAPVFQLLLEKSYLVWESFSSPDLIAPGCEQLQGKMHKGSTLCFTWKVTDIFECY